MSATSATWNSERIAQLKRCFEAGLSCSQIANGIGVTRNAVIGKMSRLGLSRPKEVITKQREQWRAVRLSRPKTPATLRTKRSGVDIFAQQDILTATFGERDARAEDVPIRDGRGCSLLELGTESCRWPINNPGADNFCYCGNALVKGLSYCLGHARIAYRPAGRRRSA